MLTFLKRAWVPLVVVVAIALGGVAVDRLRGVFGSDKIFSATGTSAQPLVPFNLKRVTYEVYGPSDTTGSVSYLDKNAQPAQGELHPPALDLHDHDDDTGGDRQRGGAGQ